jgi:hypothetical protein
VYEYIPKNIGGKREKMKNVRVHFKKWEPVGKMEGYNSKMGTMEEYNSKMGADIKLY